MTSTPLPFAVCVPTLNAASFARSLMTGMRAQTVQPLRVLVVDSSSDDGTESVFRSEGADIVSIRRDQFDHGGTRKLAADLCADAEVILFLTQDATPADSRAFERLIEAFRDDDVAAAYGRQIPRQSARVAEAFPRAFNYPGQSQIKSLRDAPALGIKTTFCSNSFAAYRLAALRSVGSFPDRTLFGEDMEVAGKLLIAGYRIAYVADARVFHSHAYSLLAELRRSFDIGAFHARNSWLLDKFGSAEREGIAYVRAEARYALQVAPSQIPELLIRNALKLIGHRLGRLEARIPTNLKRRLSMNPRFWDAEQN